MYGPNLAIDGGFDVQQRVYDEPLYLYKRWILFFHPQFAFLASLGAASILFRKAPALTVFSVFFLAVWAVTEMTQQAYIIDALNQYWRPGYLNSVDVEQKEAFRTMIVGFDGISDSQYFLLLYGFGVGSCLLGLAFFEKKYLEWGISVSMVFIGVLSLGSFLRYYAGLEGLSPLINWIYANIYGVLQTGVRIALGVWLWLNGKTQR